MEILNHMKQNDTEQKFYIVNLIENAIVIIVDNSSIIICLRAIKEIKFLFFVQVIFSVQDIWGFFIRLLND